MSFYSKLKFNLVIVENQLDHVYSTNPSHIYIFLQKIEPELINTNINKLVINTEQLTRQDWLLLMQKYIQHNIPIIDYSLENIHQSNLPIIYLPMQYNQSDVLLLKHYYHTIPKTYDFAFCGCMSPRREKILQKLRKMKLKVLRIKGWGNDRDKKIASCKIFINIHFADDYMIMNLSDVIDGQWLACQLFLKIRY